MSDNILNHKDVDEYMQQDFFTIINESDRGAVLLGSSFIENKLKEQFKRLVSNDFKGDKGERNTILKGSFDSMLNQSYLFRYIPYNLFRSIKILKTIRNKIAHKSISFQLEDYQVELNKMYTLIGKNTNLFLNDKAIDILFRTTISNMLNLKHPLKEDINAFNCEKEAIDYISNNEFMQQMIEKKRLKSELALCIILISRLIGHHFEKAFHILEGNKVISSLL